MTAEHAQTNGAGVLVLAATPIGDPDDASPRLARELAEADIVAAEDTRRLRRLATALEIQIRGRVVSYFEANETARTADLVSALQSGARVILVTDAGMPSVSDPGYRLVEAAVDAGIQVTSVPGPSAVVTALAVSGLPVSRFTFEGFPPRRAGERARWLAALAGEQRTMVFFESRHRLAKTLHAMVDKFGTDRRAAVCRELTKTHEEIRRGPLGELAQWSDESGPLGEITIVVGGASATGDAAGAGAGTAARAGAGPGAGVVAMADAVELVEGRVADGLSRRDAIAAVASELGLPKRQLYAAVVNSQSS